MTFLSDYPPWPSLKLTLAVAVAIVNKIVFQPCHTCHTFSGAMSAMLVSGRSMTAEDSLSFFVTHVRNEYSISDTGYRHQHGET